MGSFLFGGSTKQTNTGPELYLRYSTSLLNRPKTVGWGRYRVAANCTWYNGFYYRQINTSGGKGGLFGSKSGTTYEYFVSVIFSIADGPIDYLSAIYYNSVAYPPNSLPNATEFDGSYSQTPWGFLSAQYPSQALAYRGEAYLGISSLDLGTSSSLPNIEFEVTSTINIGGYDANPADVVTDFLTNSGYGVPGWPANLLGDLTSSRTYCQALGLNISPVLTDQTAGNTWLQDIATAINCEFRWSSGFLTLVPYADSNESGNGANFVVDNTPVYDLTTDDFMVNQGTLGSGSLSGDTSIVIARQARAYLINHVRLEFLDRGLAYNPNTVETWDEASIIAYGDRPSDMLQCHMFAYGPAASASCALQLARAQIATQYQFTVGSRFALLDPMDIVTVTEPALGLYRQPVRITEIQENNDRSLTITCEEYLGTVTAPLYGRQAALGTQANFNGEPGSVSAPLIFEPPYQLAGDLEVWAAISGQSLTTWGGCYVWVSNDGTNYSRVGLLVGSSRMGVTTADLPAVAEALTGQTIDPTSLLQVDLTESAGTLVSASAADMLAASTACVIGGEVVAYQNAKLTAASKYTLTPLLRGAYDTTIADHPAGTPIARLDQSIFKYPYTQDRIGSTIYLKFQSFNLYQGGVQDLSMVGAVTYTITGAPLAAQLATPGNLRTVFLAGFEQLAWDEVTDFRSGIRYRVTKGDSATTAQQVGDVAHPPFTVFGAGTYYVNAYCQPVVGLTVTSAASGPLLIAGNMLVANALKVWDQQAEGWPAGSTSAGLTLQGTAPDQFLALTSATVPGTYTIPSTDIIDLGYIGVLALNVTWKAVGVPLNQNILTVSDFLEQADVLGSAAAGYVSAYPEVQIGIVGPNDTFQSSDVFQSPDVFTVPDIVWGPWQKYLPGNYYGRFANFRMQIASTNPQVTGYLLNFSAQCSVPARIDHYQNQSVPAGGLTVTFMPDGTATAAAFNGGPDGAALPYVNVTYSNQAGDVLLITALTNRSVTIQILNGAVGVARTGVNVDVQGY